MTRLLFRSAGFGLFSDFAPWSFSSPGRLRPIRPPCTSAGSVRLCWFRSAGSASTSPLPGPRHRPSASPLGASPFSPRCCGGVHLGPRGVAVFREPADPPATPPDLHPCVLNAGAARSLAAVPWSYRIYLVAPLAPLPARFATVGEPGGWTLVLITVTFAMFLLNTAKLHSADLLRLSRLIFENEELFPTLREGKARPRPPTRPSAIFSRP